MAANAEALQAELKKYIMVFVALLVLTAVTVGVAQFDHSVAMGVTVALFVAGIKGGLVACYFMHLLNERGMIFWILGLCVLFFITLLLIPVITSSEVVAGHADKLYGVGK